MKIAILGGSFDPPHIGHVAIIKKALACLNIDKVIILPAFLNPFKHQSFTDAKTRLTWVQKIAYSLERVEVCDYEIQQNRSIPSIESVLHLEKNSYEKIYFLIGADNLSSLKKWNKFDLLSKKVEFVVATRNNLPLDNAFKVLPVDINISSTALRKQLDPEFIPAIIQEDVTKYYKENNA